jgi:hypothetical protein
MASHESTNATPRYCVTLHINAAQHLFLVPHSSSGSAPLRHHKPGPGCSAGVSPAVAGAASALRDAFRFLAKAPLRFASGQDHHNPISVGAVATTDDLLQYVVLHSVHARDALACAQYSLPWIATRIEDSVHKALLSSTTSAIARCTIVELARTIKFVAPIASVRDISIPISAAFHHAAVTFLKAFLEGKSPAVRAVDNTGANKQHHATTAAAWLSDITHASAQQYNAPHDDKSSQTASQFVAHWNEELSDINARSSSNRCAPIDLSRLPQASDVADRLAGDAKVFFAIAPQLFRGALMNDQEVLSVLRGVTSTGAPDEIYALARWVLIAVSWCHWSSPAASMTSTSRLRAAVAASAPPSHHSSIAVDAVVSLLASLHNHADATTNPSQRSTQQASATQQTYFSQVSLSSSSAYRPTHRHGVAIASQLRSNNRRPTTTLLQCDTKRLQELTLKYRDESFG